MLNTMLLDLNKNQCNSMETNYIKGVCEEMCPDKERRWREKNGLLHQFEIVNGTQHISRPKADKEKTIKEFRRSAAGQKVPKPEELRPYRILLKSVDYLIKSIIPKTDVPWSMVYAFTFDRLRAVRQDMVIQCMAKEECIPILEKIVRFHIISFYKLHLEPLSEFDPYINNIHLQECLKRLLLLYDEVHNKQSLPCRAEMEALYILHNLGSTEAINRSLNLPLDIRLDPTVKLSTEISIAYYHRNFVRLLQIVSKLPFLHSCCVYEHINKIQRIALQVLNVAYSAKTCKFPLAVLKKWLFYHGENAVEDACEHYGMTVKDGFVCFQKGNFNSDAKTFVSKDNLLEEKEQCIDLTAILLGKA